MNTPAQLLGVQVWSSMIYETRQDAKEIINTLPWFSEQEVNDILSLRSKLGGFRSVDDLKNLCLNVFKSKFFDNVLYSKIKPARQADQKPIFVQHLQFNQKLL